MLLIFPEYILTWNIHVNVSIGFSLVSISFYSNFSQKLRRVKKKIVFLPLHLLTRWRRKWHICDMTIILILIDQMTMMAEMNFKPELSNIWLPHQGSLAVDTAEWQTHPCSREEQIRLHTESVYFTINFMFKGCCLQLKVYIMAHPWEPCLPCLSIKPKYFCLMEKEMETHSSTLAWKIPWTEEPVGYSPWGLRESDMTGRVHFTSLHFCLNS